MSRGSYLLLYRYGNWHRDDKVKSPTNIRLVSKKYNIDMNKWYAYWHSRSSLSLYSYMGKILHGLSGNIIHSRTTYEVYNRGGYVVKYSCLDDPWCYKVKNLLKLVYRSGLDNIMFTYKRIEKFKCLISIDECKYTYTDEYPYFPPKMTYKQVDSYGDPFELTMQLLKEYILIASKK